MSKDISKTDNKSWNPWVGALLAIVALFGSQIIIGLVLSIYPFIKGWSGNQANNWLSSSIIAQFIFVLLAESLTVFTILSYLKRYKGSFRSIGLRKPKWTDPLLGLAGLPAYLALYFLAVNIVVLFDHGLNTSQKQQTGFNGAHGALDLVLTFFSLVILPPIAEEIVFRGLLFTSLKKVLPLGGAAVATSLLFAAGHLPAGGSSGPLYIAAIDTFSLSLVLIYLRQKTNGLWASMTLHALKNTIAFVALFALHLT
jgi:membrane protease YdiL (CAAX protease family)